MSGAAVLLFVTLTVAVLLSVLLVIFSRMSRRRKKVSYLDALKVVVNNPPDQRREPPPTHRHTKSSAVATDLQPLSPDKTPHRITSLRKATSHGDLNEHDHNTERGS